MDGDDVEGVARSTTEHASPAARARASVCRVRRCRRYRCRQRDRNDQSRRAVRLEQRRLTRCRASLHMERAQLVSGHVKSDDGARSRIPTAASRFQSRATSSGSRWSTADDANADRRVGGPYDRQRRQVGLRCGCDGRKVPVNCWSPRQHQDPETRPAPPPSPDEDFRGGAAKLLTRNPDMRVAH